MAHDTRLTPYDEQIADAYDEDAAGDEFTAYGSQPPAASDRYVFPEDPMPLFLYSDEEEPRQRGFGTGGENLRRRAVVPRILKAAVLAASAAAIAFAIVSVENPPALFANAKASLIGSSADASGATAPPQPSAAVQLASHNEPAPAAPAAGGVRTLPPAAQVVGPTRDEIALALRAAHQSQVEAIQPRAAAPPARRMDADELAALMKRAKSLIAIGDIAPARLLLERAADAQEASAALLLAQSYDPAVLGTQDMRSITPDPAMARVWYQKAAQFGSPDARLRLAQMQN